MEKYKIDRGIPLPQNRKRGRKASYPFADLEIGDSFLVPFANVRTMRSAAYQARIRMDKTFYCAKEGQHSVRVWRTA